MTPQPYHIPKCGHLAPLERYELDEDERGIIWLWEPPSPGGVYFMGVDAANGIVGWTRQFRRDDDRETDNGVVEVYRYYDGRKPDMLQVAEFAAPVDPEELADVANALGRTFAGRNEDGQCMCIVEVYPGPGGITQKMMIHKYGYTNLWVPRYVDTLAPQAPRNVVGFHSNVKTRRDLWIRSSKHMITKRAELRSPWLIEEMANCSPDAFQLTGRAAEGLHDDRVIASMLSIYAAHDWGPDVETEVVEVREGEQPTSWQATDISSSRMYDAWEDRFADLLDS